ncbi:MAG: YfjI family protein [Rhodocyclaceae bacterium]
MNNPEAYLRDVLEIARTVPAMVFEPRTVEALGALRASDPPAFDTLKSQLAVAAKLRTSDIDRKVEEAAATLPDPATWADPVLFGAGPDLPDIPAAIAPDPLGAYAAGLAHELQVPEALPLILGIAAAATAIQRRFAVRPAPESSYSESCSFFGFCLLPSGSRKSETKSRITAPLQTYERMADRKLRQAIGRMEDEAIRTEKRIARLRDLLANCDDDRQAATYCRELDELREKEPARLARPKLFIGDGTAEKCESLLAEQRGRMAIFSDEGGAVATLVGAYGTEARIDYALVGHAGGTLRVERLSRQVTVDRAALTMGIAVQPEVLTEMNEQARRRLRYSGFFARCAVVMPPNTVGRRDVRRIAPVPAALRDAYHDRILGLLETPEEIIEEAVNPPEHDEPVMLTLTSDAREVWFRYQEHMEPRMADGQELEHLRDWAGKAPGLALRLAAIFHCVAHGTGCLDVDADSMTRAVRLMEYLEVHARAVFDSLGADQATSDAQRLAGHIQRHAERTGAVAALTKTELTRLSKGSISGARLDRALAVLQDRAIIGQAFTEKTTGRTRTLYPVNPKLMPATSCPFR